MKQKSKIILLISLVLMVYQIRTIIIANYKIEKNYTQFWKLAYKSSTILAKQQYISKFVLALEDGYEKEEFASHNAIWLKTPNNEFNANLDALKTLASRLSEIQKMNPNSFEYNTAIQQITAQEQNEVKELLNVIIGCYKLKNYPAVWGWMGGILLTVEFLVLSILGAIWMWDWL